MIDPRLPIDENLLDVATFLDNRGLAALDQICLLNSFIRAHFWERAALAARKNFPLWGPSDQRFIDQLAEQYSSFKNLARDLAKLRRMISPPRAWKPWITDLSFCSLQISPYTDTHLESVLYWNDEVHELPYPAAVPTSIGAFCGQSYVVGMTVTSEGPLDDNICLGVELRNHEKVMSAMIAPFSGHLFIEYSLRGPTMRASALQPLDIVPSALWIWIQIFENGAIRFLRQVVGQEPEDAGLLPCESFPGWIKEYFPCVYKYRKTLAAAATISIDHASDSFPVWFTEKPAARMDAVWELLDPVM